jgi:hypothetical protein
MAHFAKLNPTPNADGTHTVLSVNPMNDNVNEVTLSTQTGGLYKKCSYNTRSGVYYTPNTTDVDPDQSKAFRKNFSSKGMVYNPTKDAFHSVKPFSLWTYDDETANWIPDVPMPQTKDADDSAELYDYVEGTGWVKKQNQLP